MLSLWGVYQYHTVVCARGVCCVCVWEDVNVMVMRRTRKGEGNMASLHGVCAFQCVCVVLDVFFPFMSMLFLGIHTNF